jgi:hypothetical protein
MKIPSINDIRIDTIPNGSLVRYRGMIQDMWDPEFFLGVYEEINTIQGTKVKTMNSITSLTVLEICQLLWTKLTLYEENGVWKIQRHHRRKGKRNL